MIQKVKNLVKIIQKNNKKKKKKLSNTMEFYV